VEGDRPFESFLADLDCQGRAGSAMRARVAERIGLNPSTTAAEDLLDVLERLNVLATTRARVVTA
jgi:hypothetical protein